MRGKHWIASVMLSLAAVAWVSVPAWAVGCQGRNQGIVLETADGQGENPGTVLGTGNGQGVNPGTILGTGNDQGADGQMAETGTRPEDTDDQVTAIKTEIPGEEPPRTELPAGEQDSGEQNSEEQGSQLIMLAGVEKAQMLSAVICSKNGGLVVIDGGWVSDGEHLLETIKKYGGRVSAWLLTHPHSDHAGALYYILKEKSDDIVIDNIYCSLAPSEWYWDVSPGDAPLVDALRYELSKLPEGVVHDLVGRGTEMDIDNLHITVMNNRYVMSSDPVNNSSIVYMVDTGKEKVLFLGDLGYVGGQFLLKEAGDNLKADAVQMAHHGQNGVDREVYRTIAPRLCLWPTPQWLWDNDNGGGYDSGSWRTLETRKWVEELGVEQNYAIKDGDIELWLE